MSVCVIKPPSGQVKDFYISEISTKMRLVSYTHGSVIPWITLNFTFIVGISYFSEQVLFNIKI